jgi:hypothetical protein
MCATGNDVLCRVNIPAELSYTGEARWDIKGIDKCIATLVDALNHAGILTSQSCCGHGKRDGRIDLQDGRVLLILREDDERLK